jgi:spore maturation protein CgeB|tara:strand:- start:983 stop:2017 length:1035 start_codon:yes stop_codon:yes gene_type:complete
MYNLKILIIGDFEKGNSNNFILDGFSKHVDVCCKSQDDQGELWSRRPSLYSRVRRRLGFPADPKGHNVLLKAVAQSGEYQVVIIIKGLHIKPSVLLAFKNKKVKLVSWSDDDMLNKSNQSFFYKKGLKYYDLVVTQKSFNANMDELPALGASQVLLLPKAYDPIIHKPKTISAGDKRFIYDLVFIGHFEKERFVSISFLVDHGLNVTIFGPGWSNVTSRPGLVIMNSILAAEDYAGAISQSKISLGFLRKVNRDLHTGRTMEIPACGGFLLAERSSEHLSLFKEGTEAEFFDSDEELLKKARFYLSNMDRRDKVAKNGCARVTGENHTYERRAEQILEVLYEKI